MFVGVGEVAASKTYDNIVPRISVFDRYCKFTTFVVMTIMSSPFTSKVAPVGRENVAGGHRRPLEQSWRHLIWQLHFFCKAYFFKSDHWTSSIKRWKSVTLVNQHNNLAIGICEASDHLENKPIVRDRSPHIIKLIRQGFESLTICRGIWEILHASVRKIHSRVTALEFLLSENISHNLFQASMIVVSGSRIVMRSYLAHSFKSQ